MEFLEKYDILSDLTKIIDQLNNWFLPELDEKDAKKMAKKLKKIHDKIKNKG